MSGVAKTKTEEQQLQAEQTRQAQTEQLELLEQQAMDRNKKQKKGSGPLLPILTVLLILVGLGEAALWGYFGFASFRANRALRQYEAEQSRQDQPSRAAGASAYGPRLRVESGQITWRLEEDEDIDPTAGGTASPAQNGGGQTTPSTGLIRFPKVPYALAEQDTESSSQRTAAAGDGTGTLT